MESIREAASASHEAQTIRGLTASDLEAVVALDRRVAQTSRRGYFESRLAAAIRNPKAHLQLGLTSHDGFLGFMLARLAGGEYGRKGSAAVLEALGVDPRVRGHGIGQRMMTGLIERARSRGATSIVTQSDWRNHSLLNFLDGAGFSLASREVLERRVHRMPLPQTDEEIEATPPVVRHLHADDLDAIIRIDRELTGEDRSEYLRRKLDEALHESAIRVSLVGEEDGFVVGFAMVRVDYGDFGHVESTASLETLGTQPGFAHKGLMRAILTQMIDNLAALHVERLETELARDAWDLQRFLTRFGFSAAPRLVFERTI